MPHSWAAHPSCPWWRSPWPPYLWDGHFNFPLGIFIFLLKLLLFLNLLALLTACKSSQARGWTCAIAVTHVTAVTRAIAVTTLDLNHWASKELLVLFIYLFTLFLFFPFSFLFFLGLHLQHMEVPRLGVELELQFPAYATATATPDPLTHWVRPGILNPDGVLTGWVITGTPLFIYLFLVS